MDDWIIAGEEEGGASAWIAGLLDSWIGGLGRVEDFDSGEIFSTVFFWFSALESLEFSTVLLAG